MMRASAKGVGRVNGRKKTAALLIGHGSKLKGFGSAMEAVARRLRKDARFDAVACAYLEIAPPSVPDAIDALAAEGFSEIRVLPYFLQLGRHVQEDLPAIVGWAREKHAPGVKVVLCPYLGYDDGIADVVRRRLEEKAR